MRRQLSGPMIFYSTGHSIPWVLETVVDSLRLFLPDMSISHYYAVNDPAASHRYRRWSQSSLESILQLPDLDAVHVAAFEDAGTAKEGVDWLFHVSVTDTESRGVRCIIVDLGFSEEVVTEHLSTLLNFSDSLAKAFCIESGHLHDLEDFSDQNQLGPHWFKMKGKPVEPRKIKYSDVLKQEIVDVELNPCHNHVVGAIDFTAAWTMYLGQSFLDSIDATKLGQLDAKICQLSDSLVRVTLFDDPFSFASASSIERLWDFRATLELDQIAHKFVRPW
ncbi:MAG: hypothetical protein JNL58_12215 [Planctomyces sp.]|nr:hypothetical protein [Planctomyces sp.]